MINLKEILDEIILDDLIKRPDMILISEEVSSFQELADPDFSYKYNEVKPNVWRFNDRFGNTLEVQFLPNVKEFESYYIMKNTKGKEVKIFDYDTNKDYLDPTSFQGGSDEHRSDTICKILLDEVLPEYLLNEKPSIVKLHPLNDYRYKIFMKCAEVCKERHPNIEIKPLGRDIYLINK
jgi:hypothetical protein